LESELTDLLAADFVGVRALAPCVPLWQELRLAPEDIAYRKIICRSNVTEMKNIGKEAVADPVLPLSAAAKDIPGVVSFVENTPL
jgi:hypothetical protein